MVEPAVITERENEERGKKKNSTVDLKLLNIFTPHVNTIAAIWI